MGLVVTRYDTGYRRRISYTAVVRLSGPVIILFSNSNSFYMDMTCYVYLNRLGPTYATRRLHVEFFVLK